MFAPSGQRPPQAAVFDGFSLDEIDAGPVRLRIRHGGYGGSPESMGEEAYADYRRAIHDPATVHAVCEDYRAGLGPDRAADDADRAAGRRITCPVLFCWSTRDELGELYGDPTAIWRDWAGDVRAAPIESGHHMAEEAPEQLAATLAAFLAN